MKKIIFIGLLISIFSCSKDDSPVITDSLVQELQKQLSLSKMMAAER